MPEEIVTRFLNSKKSFSKQNKRVKGKALEPPRTSLALSVFRIDNLSPQKIQKLALDHVITEGRTLYARADIRVFQVERHDLKVIPNEPPERHAEIKGWPGDKPQRLNKAQELAEEASLVVYE